MEQLILNLVKDGGPVALCLALVIVFLIFIEKANARQQHVFDRMAEAQGKVAESLDKLREHCFGRGK